MDSYGHFCRPALVPLLQAVGLDATYVKGGLVKMGALLVKRSRGGVVQLPCNDDFTLSGTALPQGHALACMSETLLMELEGLSGDGSVGPVTDEGVRRTLAWAAKHGVRLGDIRVTRGDARDIDPRAAAHQRSCVGAVSAAASR